MRARGLIVAAAASALLLGVAACAVPATGPSTPAQPSAPVAPPTGSAAEPAAMTPAPTATRDAAAAAGSDALADWQSVETADGRFRWRIPPDWSVVDESFEAEDGLGHVNAITVVSDTGQRLAYFGSAHYGDRGGACAAWDGDGTTSVPAQLHFDAPALAGEGRVVAYTREYAAGAFDFFAGYTLDDVESDRAPCLRYSDVPVDEAGLQVSFGTTFDPALWDVPSFADGAAYAETQELDDLIAMFRSLEVLPRR